MKNPFKITTTFESMVKSVFQLHLAILVITTTLDYVDPLGLLHSEPITLTLRGNVTMIPSHWHPMASATFHQRDSIGSNAIVLASENGFVRFDYTDFNKAFTGLNLLILLTDLAYMWIWLYISWTFWQVSKDIPTRMVFKRINIIRMRWLAAVVPAGVLLYNLHGRLFSQLVNRKIDYPDHLIYFPTTANLMEMLLKRDMLIALAIMVFTLILIQVFVEGNRLQEENDLTV